MSDSTSKTEWKQVVAAYARADTRQALWQSATSVLPYFALFYLAVRLTEISYWLAVPASLLAAGFLVRVFIIFHDCGHGSFFPSQKANDWMGTFTGLLTFTAYQRWKHEHAMHHASSGDLDRRGVGDVYTMTVEEYRQAPWYLKLGYRLMRYPLAMFLIGSPFMFLLMERVPLAKGARERASVWWTNLALLIIVPALGFALGWKAYLFVQLLTMYVASIAGVWMFYVQHQFEGVYWERHPQWNYYTASLEGSSFYKLPRLLQWFSGNIGFHHIHHLGPKIPSYKLEKAYRENAMFHIQPITLLESLKCLKWRVYDEANKRLAGSEAMRAG